MLKKSFLFFFLISTSIIQAQTWQDTALLLDNIMSRYKDANPGAQLAISRYGQIIYSSAKGMADLEHNAPLSKTSKIEAGSVSKQFTAASILLLEQQGKLSINDDVRKYVPEVPYYGHTITLRHLMQHTSGLKDWGSIADVAGWPRGTKTYNNDDALHIISLQKTLNNKPGDEYIYSNTNYTLLTIIVNRVSGTNLPAFTKKHIFDPAGMKNTEWRDDYKRVVANRTIAYSKSGNNYLTNMPNEYVYGHGGLLTTAEDLLTWNHFYLSGKLGNFSILSNQLSITRFNNGRNNTYAAGLVVDSTNGYASITHSGATASYRANLEYFPHAGLSIAWLSNTSQSDLGNIPSSITGLLVKNKTAVEINQPEPAKIDFRTFIPYLGAYKENTTGRGFYLYIKNDSLYSKPNGGPLQPIGYFKLAVGRARVEFRRPQPRILNFITASGDTLLFRGVDSAEVNEKTLKEYAGTYFSEETESKTEILVKDGKLMIKQRLNQVELIPVYKDGFSLPAGDIYFERDKKGRISKFFISVSRARKIEFVKIKK